ncbi:MULTISPECIES: alpha/beta hydrolase [Gordonia]|uniref:Alpha/beta hydrolase n=1 Tax=Gordonia amicalis TaxID=89053 RepID=A0ABU4DAR8_9ACTN|nr:MULTISPECIES: alpha/beta hydrolase [Gordonia]ATD70159.1 lysophospholipase [Gordonia sp. 1D]MCR8896971.1 lysophospholipase [Gordonia sp. GONU]MDJ0454171.1 alpha/beta hydrolase [Gordonia amicalis]MDV6306823.1 alpha/beta hydrolase [Gordonia amicalis]MDV7077315.1 alpha/beta hydrolase [Gordonia amicalis]
MTPEEHSFRGPHGQDIVYDVHRPEGDKRGVVVIAHGLAEHGRRYGHLAQRLVDAGFLVAIPDHVGHGRSGGKRMRLRRFSEFTGDLDTVIAHVADEAFPTFLIGHSMGGCIALDYALDHQEKLDGLILSGAAVLPGDDLSPLVVKIAPVIGKIAPGLPTTALSSTSISRDPSVVAAYDADPLVTRGKIPAGLGGAMISTMQSFPQRLPLLQLPLLVMHGGADALTDPKGSELVERLAGSEDKTLVIYDDLFHEIFNEPEQDVVLDEVVTWLRVHTPADW